MSSEVISWLIPIHTKKGKDTGLVIPFPYATRQEARDLVPDANDLITNKDYRAVQPRKATPSKEMTKKIVESGIAILGKG